MSDSRPASGQSGCPIGQQSVRPSRSFCKPATLLPKTATMSKQHSTLSKERNFTILVRHCCRLWQQSRMLLRQSTKSNVASTMLPVASTLLLVWMGLKPAPTKRGSGHVVTHRGMTRTPRFRAPFGAPLRRRHKTRGQVLPA